MTCICRREPDQKPLPFNCRPPCTVLSCNTGRNPPRKSSWYVPIGRVPESRERMSIACNVIAPAKVNREAVDVRLNPGEVRCSAPSSCTEFQGAPKPAKTVEGHVDSAGRSVAVQLCSDGKIRRRWASVVQQSAWNAISAKSRCSVTFHCTRPGRTAASWLPAPPASIRRAEPCHTVPSQFSSNTWPLVQSRMTG